MNREKHYQNNFIAGIVLSLFIGSLLAIGTCTRETTATDDNHVYICSGGSSTTYHRGKHCRGLNACKAKVQPVTIERAYELQRRPCKICKPPRLTDVRSETDGTKGTLAPTPQQLQ